MTQSVTILFTGSGTVFLAACPILVRRPSFSDGIRNAPEPIDFDTACYMLELMQMMFLILMR